MCFAPGTLQCRKAPTTLFPILVPLRDGMVTHLEESLSESLEKDSVMDRDAVDVDLVELGCCISFSMVCFVGEESWLL